MTLQDDLEEAGYTVAGPFNSCARAMTWLENGEPDLAVLDIRLKDGPCKDLAAELSRRGVPFIVYSGFRKDSNTLAEFMGGVWIDKIASRDTLLEALEGLLPAP